MVSCCDWQIMFYQEFCKLDFNFSCENVCRSFSFFLFLVSDCIKILFKITCPQWLHKTSLLQILQQRYDSYILELRIISYTSSNCLWNTRLDYILFYSGKIPCGVKDHFLHFIKLSWEHQAGLYFVLYQQYHLKLFSFVGPDCPSQSAILFAIIAQTN